MDFLARWIKEASNFMSNASSAITASGTYAEHLINGYPGIGGANNRSVTAWSKTRGTDRDPITSWVTMLVEKCLM